MGGIPSLLLLIHPPSAPPSLLSSFPPQAHREDLARREKAFLQNQHVPFHLLLLLLPPLPPPLPPSTCFPREADRVPQAIQDLSGQAGKRVSYKSRTILTGDRSQEADKATSRRGKVE